MNKQPIDPPKGCQEIPGFIVEIARGGPWLTKDGWWTTEWLERGVWDTPEAAEAAAAKWVKGNE